MQTEQKNQPQLQVDLVDTNSSFTSSYQSKSNLDIVKDLNKSLAQIYRMNCKTSFSKLDNSLAQKETDQLLEPTRTVKRVSTLQL